MIPTDLTVAGCVAVPAFTATAGPSTTLSGAALRPWTLGSEVR